MLVAEQLVLPFSVNELFPCSGLRLPGPSVSSNMPSMSTTFLPWYASSLLTILLLVLPGFSTTLVSMPRYSVISFSSSRPLTLGRPTHWARLHSEADLFTASLELIPIAGGELSWKVRAKVGPGLGDREVFLFWEGRRLEREEVRRCFLRVKDPPKSSSCLLVVPNRFSHFSTQTRTGP